MGVSTPNSPSILNGKHKKFVNMNGDIVVGKWKQIRGQVRSTLAEWLGSDGEWLAGNNDCLLGLLQEDYGIAQDRVSSEDVTTH